MARKAIPGETQNKILLKSRRRCCLCFWLDGRDEVQKGQIAHLDGNNENTAEDNLAFLCFNHHDDYDGKTRLAKGLREDEVRHWRDELYKEMEYRFRTVKRRGFELTITRFIWVGPQDEFKALFRLKNTGEAEARSPTVAIRLPEKVGGEVPPERYSMPNVDPFAVYESQQDIFEPGGRVAIKELGGMNPVLMAGHSFTFDGLLFHMADFPPGAIIELEYRVNAEGMAPILGKFTATVPSNPEELLPV